MQDTIDPRSTLRALILEDYLFTDDDSALTDDMSFLKEGILDSMGILEIIIAEDEMVPQNLDSINSLLGYIERKQKAA
jgi:acyl carrier protein